jgi:phage baseplate assembly protein W
MKRQALEFVVDTAMRSLVEERMRQSAGDGLDRLTIAPVDGTARCRITALVAGAIAPAVMRAVMNALDEKG